jgi:DNA-binding PucR family transcriptional regulator
VNDAATGQPPPRGEELHAILALLRGLTAERPELLAGPVASLHRMDATGRSDYVRSLQALFDHGGDVPRAAESLSLHPNTLRYRVRRMRELTGLNLGDPIERLGAELQLRILFPATEAAG